MIKQEDTNSKGAFYIEEANKRIAELTYSKAGSNKLILDHTGVDEEHRGTNLGYQLVEEATKYARQHDLKILPLCPFAKVIYARHDHLQDVLLNKKSL